MVWWKHPSDTDLSGHLETPIGSIWKNQQHSHGTKALVLLWAGSLRAPERNVLVPANTCISGARTWIA